MGGMGGGGGGGGRGGRWKWKWREGWEERGNIGIERRVKEMKGKRDGRGGRRG